MWSMRRSLISGIIQITDYHQNSTTENRSIIYKYTSMLRSTYLNVQSLGHWVKTLLNVQPGSVIEECNWNDCTLQKGHQCDVNAKKCLWIWFDITSETLIQRNWKFFRVWLGGKDPAFWEISQNAASSNEDSAERINLPLDVWSLWNQTHDYD